MDHEIEKRYFVHKVIDYAKALEDGVTELQILEENRVLFLLDGRMFEVLAWVDAEADMLCITTRTADMPLENFEEAVKFLKETLELCWDYCVAVAPVEARYDLSMAVFLGGFTFEAFDSAVYNLLSCAEAIEKKYEEREKKQQP